MERAASRGFVLGATGGTLLIGILIGALVVGSLPVGAAVGDAAILGAVNNSGGHETTFRGHGGDGVLKIRNTTKNPALDLRVDGNAAPMVLDSTRRVKKLNADRVDGFQANQLVRASFASTPNVVDANGAAVSATIEAPRPGILVMGGSIEAFGTTYDSWGCRLKVDGVTVGGTSMFSSTNDQGGDHTRNYNEDCSVDGAQVVGAGTHSVDLDVYLRNSVGLFEAAVWVIYVPFDGFGSRITAVPDSEPDARLPADRPDMASGG